MQIEKIIQGKAVICEYCGFEFKPSMQDYKDIVPTSGVEPQNLFRPGDLMGRDNLLDPMRKPRRPDNFKPLRFPGIGLKEPLIRPSDNHPTINDSKILTTLKFEWMSLQELANKLNMTNKRDFYILRMKLNELNRQGKIQLDYQVNKVLVRRRHS